MKSMRELFREGPDKLGGQSSIPFARPCSSVIIHILIFPHSDSWSRSPFLFPCPCLSLPHFFSSLLFLFIFLFLFLSLSLRKNPLQERLSGFFNPQVGKADGMKGSGSRVWTTHVDPSEIPSTSEALKCVDSLSPSSHFSVPLLFFLSFRYSPLSLSLSLLPIPSYKWRTTR